jgi:hypothetical protein
MSAGRAVKHAGVEPNLLTRMITSFCTVGCGHQTTPQSTEDVGTATTGEQEMARGAKRVDDRT